MISAQRAKPSALRLRIIKTLITASALLAALIGATAFTSGPEAAIDTAAGSGFTESLEAAADALIGIFSYSSNANVPCAIREH